MAIHGSPLGTYLRDRRERLDPGALGFPSARRRTPGLRREEVAQRAHVSATWYTWLEQGRGGAPSAEVLERIARALVLTEIEREHLFFLGLGRAPERVAAPSGDGVTPRLQRVLDALDTSPAFIKTLWWDVLAWNRAASLVMTDYGQLPPEERNILRQIFCNARVRAALPDWQGVARLVVAAFRADVARAGHLPQITALVDDLCRRSPEFDALWRDHDVQAHDEGNKVLHHPVVGPLSMEYASFSVDGRPDLGMLVYSPAGPEDAARIRSLLDQSARRA